MNAREARLQNGDSVPHFAVRAHDGAAFDYSTIWQRRNLVLVAIPPTDRGVDYFGELVRQTSKFSDHECTLLVTPDRIPGLAAPGLLVADRWGEIVHIVTAGAVTDLPAAIELLQWVEAIEYRCPECEGEAR